MVRGHRDAVHIHQWLGGLIDEGVSDLGGDNSPGFVIHAQHVIPNAQRLDRYLTGWRGDERSGWQALI
jgi:hypothetical protein